MTERLTAREQAPRLALRPEEAAAAIGVSRAFFYESVLPQLRIVRVGRLRLVPCASSSAGWARTLRGCSMMSSSRAVYAFARAREPVVSRTGSCNR